MGLAYDPVAKKWNISYEKIDYKIDYPTNFPTNLKTDYEERVIVYVPVQQSRQITQYRSVSYQVPYTISYYNSSTQRMEYRTEYRTEWRQEPYTVTETYTVQSPRVDTAASNANKALNDQNRKANEINAATNASNLKLNQDNSKTNTLNQSKNQAYDKTVSVASSTRGGDYVSQREVIRKLEGIDEGTKNTLENYFKAFYTTEKLQTWDAKLGAKPLYGDFDPKFYKEQNPTVAEAWAKAVANDDVDITQRYGENGFYLQHYTTQGKPAGLRGNPAEKTTAAISYVEKKPTDKDIQDVRNLQLGIDTTTTTDRLLKIPEVAAEWDKAKKGDSYWTKLAKEKYLDPENKDEFAALFRLSDRASDKQIAFNYNANAGYGITELEDAVNKAVGEKATIDVKKFGALTQNVLKDTIAEVRKAREKEQMLSLLSGFGGYSEVININKTLADSLMNDTGIGGIMDYAKDPEKTKESLEKKLQGVTGVRNNTVYNWEKWFNESIKTKYSKELEVEYTAGTAKEKMKVDEKFAKEFVDKYLIPRFDTSKSMDEFIEYLDVRQEEQNPFQTQDLVNAVTQVASLRSKAFLDGINKINDRYFDANFYFNPTGNKARGTDYADQAKTVASDWEAAKKGDSYWAQQAYRFGVNVNDKEAFAKMHFQVKGQGKGYDAAEDILTAGKVQDEIYNNILPALKAEALKQGSVFGQFITPEEFTDRLLKGVDPNNKSTWNDVLKKYGLENFKGSFDELKEYINEVLRTGKAQEIREGLKYINEQGKKPTQANLGTTYIERLADYKPSSVADTQLYQVFKKAGYAGTEDEFYEKFFPDLDRSEQALLTKAGKNDPLKTQALNLKDPFAALGSISGLLGNDEEDSEKTTSTKDDSFKSSYFRLSLEDPDEENYKSKSGDQILGEFTSMFKGL